MRRVQKIKTRILIDWPEGRDAEPRVLTVAPTMAEAIELEQFIKRALMDLKG